ncbi:hypothetical protein [Bacillus sp. FSL K6-3431]|uniref:hypothetical protein n=1 Tax=Bacillus sp. FSL K6-3431 TaxID=2921500 RepID=UPI0030F8B2CF
MTENRKSDHKQENDDHKVEADLQGKPHNDKSEEDMILSEKLRFKNADDIYK